jgi:16S rRNA C967 or C1407 C5-methylase (RsmB/RsmF family)
MSMDALPIPDQLAGFAERLAELAGADGARDILRVLDDPVRVGYWVNPLRSGAPVARSQAVPGLPGCWSVAADRRAAIVAAEHAQGGAIYPINPSSAFAVQALAPRPDEEILDLAAAPGGKTLLMAAAMENRGRIAAVEPVQARFHRMRANLARCGATNVEFYLRDGRGVGRKVPERFDAVLLDAPCSSEARIRLRDPASYVHWKPRKIRETARKQKSLLRSAFTALKPGGRLLYCTCAFAPEENEMPVDNLLRREPAAALVDIDVVCPHHTNGLTRWRGRDLDTGLERAVRVIPDGLWDGFFLCKVVKRPD